MIFLFGGLLGAVLCFVALYLVAVSRQKTVYAHAVQEPLVIEAVDPAPMPTLKPAHRVYSASEQKELATLINTYIVDSYTNGRVATESDIIILAEVYDDALKLRYGAK